MNLKHYQYLDLVHLDLYHFHCVMYLTGLFLPPPLLPFPISLPLSFPPSLSPSLPPLPLPRPVLLSDRCLLLRLYLVCYAPDICTDVSGSSCRRRTSTCCREGSGGRSSDSASSGTAGNTSSGTPEDTGNAGGHTTSDDITNTHFVGS